MENEAALKKAASFWLNLLKSQHDERWWGAMQMLLQRSRQPSMDFQTAYDVTLVWLALWDLKSAVKSGLLKNSKLMVIFINALAEEYDIKFGELLGIYTELDQHVPYQGFLNTYKLMDKHYEYGKDEDGEVLAGFDLFASKSMEFSYLGNLLTRNWSQNKE